MMTKALQKIARGKINSCNHCHNDARLPTDLLFKDGRLTGQPARGLSTFGVIGLLYQSQATAQASLEGGIR
ncbi:MAG: hypothetical protein ACJA0N_001612 [Pseudohongiellaceae bacterium]|jgi:hypothetical protein